MIFFNRYFDKNRLKALVLWSLTRSGEKTTIDLVENLKDLGFHYATQAGLSLSIDDLKIPPNKAKLILEAEKIVQSSQQDYEIGNLTVIERFQQMIDVWHRTSEVLKQNVVQHFRSTDILNPVYMMAFSGARGNISQVRQLVGMRGLMADPQGQILDFPIRSNFREGLTLTEYVISCYGARKGLVDTALRTANSGYLTRRLVDVAQHIIVRQLDCGTKNGILVTDMKDGKKVLLSLQKRIVGRVLAEPIDSIADKDQDISPSLAAKIAKLRKQILVRSPLTCEAKNSVCQLCYGWSLAHGNLVSLGEAVGILAAQSIGEPGTQLTMRTFHTGGVFSGDVMQEIRSPINGIIKFSSPLQGSLIRTLHGKIAFLTKTEGEFSVQNQDDLTLNKRDYQIPKASVLFARQFEYVEEKQLLVEYSSFVVTSSQGIQAKYNLNSEKEGQIYFENVLLVVKGGKEGDIIKTALKFGSIWILAGKLYESPIRSRLFIKRGDLIDTNSILNESIFATPYTGFLETLQTKSLKKGLLNKTSVITNSIKQETDYLQQILNPNSAIIYQKNSKLLKKTYSNDIQLTLKQPFTRIFLKNIYFKKFGYFFSVGNFDDITLFWSNRLYKAAKHLNQFELQIFDKKNLDIFGIYFFNKKTIQSQKGEFFVLPENFYEITNPSFKKKPTLRKKFEKIIFIENQKIITSRYNRQKNKKNIISEKKQFLFIQSSIIESDDNENKNFSKLTKKKFIFKENPYRNKYSNLKAIINPDKIYKKRILIKKNKSYKGCNIPGIHQEKTNRFRNKTLIQSSTRTNLFSNNIEKINNFRVNNNIKFTEKKISFKNLNLKFASGWVILPDNISNSFYLHSKFYRPGSIKNVFNFDQTSGLIRIIKFEKNITVFDKNTSIKNIRFVKNKLFSNINSRENKECIKEKETVFFTKNIIRNSVYKSNNYKQVKFILLKTKGKELNSINRFKKQKLLQKLSNNLYLVKFYSNNSFLFNKQKNTRLKVPFPSIDLHLYSINPGKKENLTLPKKVISFKIPKTNKIKEVKIEVLSLRILQFSLLQKINTSTSLNLNNLSTEKFVLTKQKAVFEQSSLSFNSFSSPLTGEITSIKTDILGKQKSLLLTKQNQISFFNPKNDSFVKIGQLLRYGDKITENIAVQESGQIIEIDNNKITIRKAQPILFSSQGVFHIDNGDFVEKNSPLITLFYQKLKTEDIVQGIPKIEELFEARQTKEGETLQENLHTKLNFFFNFYKQQYTSQEAVRKSIQKIQQILVNNVQKVYQSQGVTIADKHIEIIVRQMTTKVKITESGRTGLLRGELIDLEWVEVINLGIEAQNEMVQQGIEVEKAEYEPIILGITKAALETESFISASSFQETTRILSRAAVERKTDFLRGLKENVILGHLIPAGTGFTLSFDPQIKMQNNQKKLSWSSYKDIVKIFS